MDKQIEAALRQAAREQQALDTDLVLFAPFADLVAKVSAGELSAPEAVRAMRERKPVLFRETDWSKIAKNADDYQREEEAFRAGLRTSRRAMPNEWRDLDSARLESPEELAALQRSLNGTTNSYDRALLQRALGRQRAQDAAAFKP